MNNISRRMLIIDDLSRHRPRYVPRYEFTLPPFLAGGA